jgi:hypothetical protein
MTAITFNTATFANTAAEKLRGLARALSEAVDAFAAYRMQHAVPEQELRRAEREIGHYRRAMQAHGCVAEN